jgi:pyruvate dehydrogenase E2 component (dihydrolipoamide acetyltransferase)
MPIKIEMPRLSDTMQAGTVVKWNVKEGQKVKSGDVIADIETDKATMELQSFDDGTVASIAVAEGQNVPVGTTILVLAGEGEDASALKSGGGAAKEPARAAAASGGSGGGGQSAGAGNVGATGGATATASPAAPKAAPASVGPRPSNGAHAPGAHAPAGGAHADGGRIFVSPLARRIAEESGVDLRSVQGTGPSGRIIRRDVEGVLAGGQGAAAPAEAPAERAPARAPSAPRQAPVAVPPLGAQLEAKVVPLSNMRRTIARRLVESKQTVPHYQVTVEVDMDALVSLRKQLNEQLEPQGVKLSVNDFLVRACALAMHQHPFVNSRWSERTPSVSEGAKGGAAPDSGPSIEILSDVNIGIAIALPVDPKTLAGGGLVVGTVRGADRVGLRQISAESKRLAEKARAKGLTLEEMSDSTFTISNLGMFGVSHFTAIINPPNVAILAVGAAIERPVVKDGKVVPGSVMSMTMSSDHRVVDGAMAAAYLATVRGLLEKPATLLV